MILSLPPSLSILFNTNHIFIGVSYILLSVLGGSSGFIFSALLRLELSIPGYAINSILLYSNFVSLHGILMLFLLIMSILIGGFGNFLIPNMFSFSGIILPRAYLVFLV